MIREERMAVLVEWQSQLKATDSALDALGAVVGNNPDSQMCKAIHGMQASYTAAVSQLIGDDAAWLEWYWLENDFGTKRYEANTKAGEELRPIATLDDLLNVIMGGAE